MTRAEGHLDDAEDEQDLLQRNVLPWMVTHGLSDGSFGRGAQSGNESKSCYGICCIYPENWGRHPSVPGLLPSVIRRRIPVDAGWAGIFGGWAVGGVCGRSATLGAA